MVLKVGLLTTGHLSRLLPHSGPPQLATLTADGERKGSVKGFKVPTKVFSRGSYCASVTAVAWAGLLQVTIPT